MFYLPYRDKKTKQSICYPPICVWIGLLNLNMSIGIKNNPTSCGFTSTTPLVGLFRPPYVTARSLWNLRSLSVLSCLPVPPSVSMIGAAEPPESASWAYTSAAAGHCQLGLPLPRQPEQSTPAWSQSVLSTKGGGGEREGRMRNPSGRAHRRLCRNLDEPHQLRQDGSRHYGTSR